MIRPREPETQKLVRLYRTLVQLISTEFIANISLDYGQMSVNVQELSWRLDQLDYAAQKWARRNIVNLYEAIQRETIDRLEQFGLYEENDKKKEAFLLINQNTLDIILHDPEVGFLTALLFATSQIRRKMITIRDQVKALADQGRAIERSVSGIRGVTKENFAKITNALARELSSNKTSTDLIWQRKFSNLGGNNLMKNLATLPIVEVPSKEGVRRYRLDRYSEIVARTKTWQTVSLARRNTLMQHSQGLIQISSNPSKYGDACDLYIGRVFGLTKKACDEWGVPHVNHLPNGGCPFHPSCRHNELPYFPDAHSAERKKMHFTTPPEWGLKDSWGNVDKQYRQHIKKNSPGNPNYDFERERSGQKRSRKK